MMAAHRLRRPDEHDDPFEYDVVLPIQVHSVHDPSQGQRRLMIAVLTDAIDCFEKYLHAKDGPGQRLFHQAEEWLLDADTGWILSFETICDVLGLDAAQVRANLERWREREMQRAGASAEAAPANTIAPPVATRHLGERVATEGECRRTGS